MFRGELNKICPSLNESYSYGVVFSEGQFDESRLLIDSILTSTGLNVPSFKQGVALNYAKLEEFTFDDYGKINGAILLDKINQRRIAVRCKVAINSTGIFADQIRKKANPKLERIMMQSRGAHLSIQNRDLI